MSSTLATLRVSESFCNDCYLLKSLMTHRFFVDTMLGSLATILRMCGYDTVYSLDRGVVADDEILTVTREEDRQLVTRDAELAATGDNAILVESTVIEEQLRTLRRAGVELSLDRPERCSHCNGCLDRVEAESTPAYAPDPTIESVWQCQDCGQYYWMGSHWDAVDERLATL